jgi:hypothetical protein
MEDFDFPTPLSSTRSSAPVFDRVCLPPGDPFFVPDNSCSPGFVPAGSSGLGMVSSSSPVPLLTASASILASFSGSSYPPLRREVKGPCCKNPSGILDWGPASRCLFGPLRSTSSLQPLPEVLGSSTVWHLRGFKADQRLTLVLLAPSVQQHCHCTNLLCAVPSRPHSASA